MAENMTTSIFLIGNEFQCAPPHFSLAEKRKRRADETRERKTQLTTLFMSGLKPRPPEELHARIGLAADELAGAGAADEFSGVDHGFAARENGFRRAPGVNALEHRIV